jgi:hypothetical protein
MTFIIWGTSSSLGNMYVDRARFISVKSTVFFSHSFNFVIAFSVGLQYSAFEGSRLCSLVFERAWPSIFAQVSTHYQLSIIEPPFAILQIITPQLPSKINKPLLMRYTTAFNFPATKARFICSGCLCGEGGKPVVHLGGMRKAYIELKELKLRLIMVPGSQKGSE